RHDMKSRTLIAVLAMLAWPAAAIADPGHDGERAYGEPGNPKKPARVVQVVMREADGKMEFLPNRVEIKKGEQVK
uniref:hypothetical protein n=1 Tax=Stenotrophomonas maltophilia TaxID=40324 RepID=UPI001954CAA9